MENAGEILKSPRTIENPGGAQKSQQPIPMAISRCMTEESISAIVLKQKNIDDRNVRTIREQCDVFAKPVRTKLWIKDVLDKCLMPDSAFCVFFTLFNLCCIVRHVAGSTSRRYKLSVVMMFLSSLLKVCF